MNERAVIAAVAGRTGSPATAAIEWDAGPERIVIGKDVLELLSTSMYVDPMTVYREYIQNAADAIDEARAANVMPRSQSGRVDIKLDAVSRVIKIRDNGKGLSWDAFLSRMCNLGASAKRGTSSRGFRGVGRLAGLGYCQELFFRSRSSGEDRVAELRWDCRQLKSILRGIDLEGDLANLVREVVRVRRISSNGFPARFFEVELRGVARHRNDRMLNPKEVEGYLSQTAPVPFAPSFRFGEDISAALRPYVSLCELGIHINDAEKPIYRPHRNRIEIEEGEYDRYVDLQVHEIPALEGGLAAIAWVLHHGYSGAIPTSALVKGMRSRSGNMQIGGNNLLEDLFPEPRFNGWSVGEVHIIDKRLVPNGRRDNFDQNVHLDNVLNHLAPLARDIARRCRQSSIARKWVREFELNKFAALDHAEAIGRGGLSRLARQSHSQSAAKCLSAMRRVVSKRRLPEETRPELHRQTEATATRVSHLLKLEPSTAGPLQRFRPQVRAAYEHVIGLIYDCASNRAAAKALVTKILANLETTAPQAKAKKARTRSLRKQRPKGRNRR